MSKRIRCSCGRVYDPGKHAACPVCGTTNVVLAEPPPPPNESGKPAIKRIAAPPPLPSPTKASPGVSLNPRHLAIGVAAIFLIGIVIAFSHRGGQEKSAVVVAPTPIVAKPTLAPVSTTPAPTNPPSTPAASPITTPPQPTRPPVVPPQPPSGLTNSLAEQIAQAAPGATIQVPPGTYPGGLVASHAIHLVGANDQVFIQSPTEECLSVRAPGVTVQNIRFSRNGPGTAPAISVADGADLEMQNCLVQTNASVAVDVTGKAEIKASGCVFTARESSALSLTKSAHGDFRQVSFNDSRIGLWLALGAQAELHSCAFSRDGGAIMVLNNAPTAVQADDCKFINNAGGIDLAGATLNLTNCTISQNGVHPHGADTPPVIALYNKANATLTNVLFDSNEEGIALREGSRLEVEKCRFANNGSRGLRDVIPVCFPIWVSGQGASARLHNASFADSAQGAAVVMAGAKLELEEVEISDTPTAGLVVGDRVAGAATAEIRRCRFRNNATGLGVFAGSSATVREVQFWDNQDGIIVVDDHSQLQGEKLDFQRNRDVGLFAHGLGSAMVKEAQFKDNKRDAVAGRNGKEAERGTLALEDCQLSGSRAFSIGACRGSDVSLTNCNFAGTKTELYKEAGARVQRNAPAPTVAPTASSDSSLTETSPTPEETAPNVSPSPTSKVEHHPHRRPTPRPHAPTLEEIRRTLHQLLPGN